MVLLVLIAATVAWQLTQAGRDLASEAVVSASSTEAGFSARDVATSGIAATPGAAWQSKDETIGAWVELSWTRSHVLQQVVLVRNPLNEQGATEGYLSFGDGSRVQVRLSGQSRDTVIPFTPRSVDRLRFTVSGVSAGARAVTIAEFIVSADTGDDDVVSGDVPDGNAATSASVTQSVDAEASDPRTLQDGSGVSGPGGTGADWTSQKPGGAWVQLAWSKPRELSSVEVVGSPRSAASLARATLTFGDGATLPVGAVLPDPDRPTIISFMPRVVTSVRINFDRVVGTGALGLSELRVYERGATPVRSPSAALVGPPILDGPACGSPTPGVVTSEFVVRCPRTGSIVNESVDFQVSAAPGYTDVSATVWPGDGSVPAGASVRATPDASGAATLAVNLGGLPAGPLTVAFEATGPERTSAKVFFQLYHRGDGGGDIPSSQGASGRTLAYDEEFDRPVSLTRNGLGADYAGAKPTYNGDQDFGDAIFPGSSAGSDNVKVVDNRYLRIDVEPSPQGADPQGWGRTHVGGLLASARQGGSGFSAQYGYFEARMLAPAAPGTWPAFWTLPSDNLIEPKPVQAEFDAVELYGHDPKFGCQSTHQHIDGKDSGVANCGPRFDTDRSGLSWHTYGVAIDPSSITFYMDGVVVATAPQVEGGDAPMFFLLDLALGGGWPVDLEGVQQRAQLYVDYVRVYV